MRSVIKMPGSDKFVNYTIRPSKAIERKMMCELLREIQVLTSRTEIRYIGLGARYFVDFLMLHNEFGIKDMISIEAAGNAQEKKRYEFNKPLKYIKIQYGHTSQVLPQIEGFGEKLNFVWLDYDSKFSDFMVDDAISLMTKLEVGSIYFMSCCHRYEGINTSEIQESFKNFNKIYFKDDIEKKHYSTKQLPYVINNILSTNIHEAIKKRNFNTKKKVKFKRLLFLTYADGAPMLTIGGIIVDDVLEQRMQESNLIEKYDFLRAEKEEYYKIEIPKFTQKEISHVLKEIPISKEEYEKKADKFHGIEFEEIETFEKIYRYFPFYTEGRINN